MPRQRMWTMEHIDFLEEWARSEELTGEELATKMSKQFRHRVTKAQINVLLQRMRTPSDPFFRNVPYRRKGARFIG